MHYLPEHDEMRAVARDPRDDEIVRLRQELADLSEALELRDDFIAMLGHQLRNPLAPLVIAVQLLQERLWDDLQPPSPQVLQQLLNALSDGLQRFTDLIERVFDMSSISTGRVALQPERVDLGREVAAWLERHDSELRAARCELTAELEETVVGSWDRSRIEQIIDSLLGNAIRYGAGHPIAVKVSSDPHNAILVVRDEGIGIAHAEHKRVFERFVRGSRGRRASGLGLGLWIVDELCRVMGGDVSLTSELGRGATFTVTLPLVREP